jgi:ubiquinone/menaquinone biosynthesis C-methylase UbiE
MGIDPHLLAFYSEGTFERDRHRLGRGRLEFARTQELLRRFLPPAPANVLDVGGGAGVHASWLVRDGYRVQLVDPVPALIEQAQEAALAQRDHPFAARVGDARELTEADRSVDVVLLLGPLYHLPKRHDRLMALREATRVLKPQGVIAAAAISRYGALLDRARRGDLDEATMVRTADTLATGRHDPSDGFTVAYLHRLADLAEELSEAGVRDVRIVGIEGPGSMFFETGPREGTRDTPIGDERVLEGALRAAVAVEDVPELLGASGQLLGVGRV